MSSNKIPIREGFFTWPLEPPEQVRLMGSRCQSCGETFLGKVVGCLNCQSTNLEDIVLSNRSKLWSYTVARHRPLGDYKGPDPPLAIGMVELPEGLRILSILRDCEVDALKVGMDLELQVERLYEDAEGNDVMSFAFRPTKKE